MHRIDQNQRAPCVHTHSVWFHASVVCDCVRCALRYQPRQQRQYLWLLSKGSTVYCVVFICFSFVGPFCSKLIPFFRCYCSKRKTPRSRRRQLASACVCLLFCRDTFLSITFNLCPFARWWRRRHRQRWWWFVHVCFLYSCFSFFKFKLALCLCGCHLRLNFWINFSHELGEVRWRMLARVW